MTWVTGNRASSAIEDEVVANEATDTAAEQWAAGQGKNHLAVAWRATCSGRTVEVTS